MDASSRAPRVCIVGGGIGGASVAWHLRRARPDCHITVLEKAARVGGRLRSWRDPQGRVAAEEGETGEAAAIELGGSIFHSVNETMVELARACEVPLREPARPEVRHSEAEVYGTLPEVGIWDERSGSWTLRVRGGVWVLLQLIWRYGWNLVRVSRHANSVKISLQKMYRDHRVAADVPYCRSVEEMLVKTGLGAWASRSFSELGYAPHFVSECLDPISRTIYARGAASVNGYCGLAAVIAADGGGLYSCPIGNAEIVSKLFELSNVELLREGKVTSVKPGSSGWQVSSSERADKHFDAVVLACPLEMSGIDLPASVAIPARQYRQMVVTLVSGDLSLDEAGSPQTVLSCGPGDFEGRFFSAGAVASTVGGERDIWKVFSASPLSDADLGAMFRIGYDVLMVHPWRRCFSDLSPQQRYPPMKLAAGLYFANAMEALAPSMEAAAWCGKNVALMVAEDL